MASIRFELNKKSFLKWEVEMPEKEIRNDIFGVSFPILFYRNVNKAKNYRVIKTL